MTMIDSNILERDAGGKPLRTFPHPALDFAVLLQQCSGAGKAVNRDVSVTIGNNEA
jgi:hypothetical protein